MHMRPFVPTPTRWLPALAMVWFALAATAQRPPESRSSSGVQFTESKSGGGTNQVDITTKSTELRALDPSLRKPFELFNAGDSFSGAMTPPPIRRPPPSPAETKRIKDALDRKKNWVFLTPEEIYGVQTPEEMMRLPEYGPNGELLEPKNSLERYLERMEKKRETAVSNQLSNLATSPFGESEEEASDKSETEEKPVLGFLSGPGMSTSGFSQGVSLFNQPLVNPAITPNKTPDALFNLGNPPPTVSVPARSAAHEASIKEFKQKLESWSGASRAFDPGFAISTPNAFTPPPALSLDPNGLATKPAALPARSLSTPPATFGVAVPSYTPAYSPPPMPSPAPRLPPTPAFELPTRKF